MTIIEKFTDVARETKESYAKWTAAFSRISEIPNYSLNDVIRDLSQRVEDQYLLDALFKHVKIRNEKELLSIDELATDSVLLNQPIQNITDRVLVCDKLISDLILEKKIESDKYLEECRRITEKRKIPGFYFKNTGREVIDACYYYFEESFEELQKLVNETFEETSVPLNETSWSKVQKTLSLIKKYFDTELENIEENE